MKGANLLSVIREVLENGAEISQWVRVLSTDEITKIAHAVCKRLEGARWIEVYGKVWSDRTPSEKQPGQAELDTLVVTGTIGDGFQMFGPFESDDAVPWAERNCNEEWWMVPLESPDGDQR